MKIIALADQYDFPVHMVNAPIYDKLSATEEFQCYLMQQQLELSSLTVGHLNIHYTPNVIAYPIDLMASVDHLVYDGAIDYTKSVSAEIKSLSEIAP